MSYTIIATKNKEDMQDLLHEINKYILKDKKPLFNNYLKEFEYYTAVKKGYTKILTKFWKDNKIYVEIVCFSNDTLSRNSIYSLKENMEKTGFNKCGIILNT